MKVIKVLTNGRVISAIISALGAIVSAFFAGCKLYVGEMTLKEFEAEIFSAFNTTTNEISEVIK